MLDQAGRDHDRYLALKASRSVSESDVDKSRERLAVAEADLARSEATIVEAERQVVTAREKLLYEQARLADTRIIAPFGGIVLSWPDDKGEWLPLVVGRSLASAHYEMIADRLLGLRIGDSLKLGKDRFTVVGITEGMIGQGGDGLAFFTVTDALSIQFDSSPESIRLERSARRVRAIRHEIGRIQPSLMDKADLPARQLPAVPRAMISAALVKVAPGVDPAKVSERISGWKDVSVHSSDQQRVLLLKGTVDRARRQIGLFTALLVIISAIIMALILYTLTLDKTRDIALLKLMGARNSVILALILQQAIFLGGLGYLLAWYVGQWIFPHFPRRVIIMHEDLFRLGIIVIVISVLSSLLGIWKAMKIQPNEVLS